MRIALASFATILWLIRKRAAGQPLLPYEPRRPVPWTFLAPLLVLAEPLLGVVATLSTSRSASDAVYVLTLGDLWVSAGSRIMIGLMCCTILSIVTGADAHDLGLPTNWRQTARDVGVGALAFFAVLLPVYIVQTLLMTLSQSDTVHPLLEQFAENPSLEMALAAAALASVSAPVYEEIAFRLVFQGWLERFTAPAPAAVVVDPATAEKDVTPKRPTGFPVESDPTTAVTPEVISMVDDGSAPPCSWAPILISGSLFAVVHIGQGWAPISLLPLGFVLGYLYQRTHRLAASMTCHALFNGYSILSLWLHPELIAP